MPANTDYRMKAKEGLSFFVYDNLEGTSDIQIYKYDTLQEAICQYKKLPKTWMSAIGISINDMHMVDLVQRRKERDVLVTDYEKMDVFSKDERVKQLVSELGKELSIGYQLIHGIHPRCAVLASTERKDDIDSYLNNKVLYISKRSRSTALFASINEVYVEGRGWMDAQHFLRGYSGEHRDHSQIPIVRRINATYKEMDTGYVGQCDMSPQEYEALIIKTKAYALSFVDKKDAIEPKEMPQKRERLDKTIKEIKSEQKKKEHPVKKETGITR